MTNEKHQRLVSRLKHEVREMCARKLSGEQPENDSTTWSRAASVGLDVFRQEARNVLASFQMGRLQWKDAANLVLICKRGIDAFFDLDSDHPDDEASAQDESMALPSMRRSDTQCAFMHDLLGMIVFGEDGIANVIEVTEAAKENLQWALVAICWSLGHNCDGESKFRETIQRIYQALLERGSFAVPDNLGFDLNDLFERKE